MANGIWTNHNEPFAWMLIYNTITTNFERESTYDLSVPCQWAHYKVYKNAWLVGIEPSKPKLWLIELEQITTKLIAWTLIYDSITINFEGKNTFDLSVPCEWAHYKLHRIGPYKPKLWLIELEQITTKPFAWILIYDTMPTNFEGKNTFELEQITAKLLICMDVNVWYDHDKSWRGKYFWFKCSMWMSSLQAT